MVIYIFEGSVLKLDGHVLDISNSQVICTGSLLWHTFRLDKGEPLIHDFYWFLVIYFLKKSY